MSDITHSYLYLCGHTLCINGITHTVCRISHILYVWHNMHYIWHHTHTLWHHNTLFMALKLVYLTSHLLYLTPHPRGLCHHPQIMDHITLIVCKISQPKYVWYHKNCIWHHIHSLRWNATWWHHTHSIHVITPSISDITFTESAALLTVYSQYHTHSMCDIKPTIGMMSYEFCMTSHPLFMTSKHCSHDIISTLFMTSQSLYLSSQQLNLCRHTCCIHYITASMDVITPGLHVTSHNSTWHYIHSLWHHNTLWHQNYWDHVITPSICDIASTEAAPLHRVYWLYHTYYICDIKPTIYMTHMNSIWHHIHSL